MITEIRTNKHLVFILISLMVLFSSCDNNDNNYVGQGTYDYSTNNTPFQPETDARGYFSQYIEIYAGDIYGYNPRVDRLEYIGVDYSSFVIKSPSFEYGDRINARLSTNDGYLDVYLQPYSGVAEVNDYALRDFMENCVMDRVLRQGYVRLHIEGTMKDNWGNNMYGLIFDIEMRNNLALYFYTNNY